MNDQQTGIPGISVGNIGPEEMTRRFGFHDMDTEELTQHEELHFASQEYAEWLAEFLPDGRAKDIAIERLEEAAMWAHKAIAEENT